MVKENLMESTDPENAEVEIPDRNLKEFLNRHLRERFSEQLEKAGVSGEKLEQLVNTIGDGSVTAGTILKVLAMHEEATKDG